jgi:hypothetical protein
MNEQSDLTERAGHLTVNKEVGDALAAPVNVRHAARLVRPPEHRAVDVEQPQRRGGAGQLKGCSEYIWGFLGGV